MKETHDALVGAPGVHFIGNVEGRDVMTDRRRRRRDRRLHRQRRAEDPRGRAEAIVSVHSEPRLGSTPEARAAADVLAPVLEPLYDYIDPETTAGAVLLGVDGVCIISHGGRRLGR